MASSQTFKLKDSFPSSTSISIGYLHLRGRHIIVSRNLNVPRFPASAGVDNLGRPDPNWGNISTYESSGDSYYNGMIVSLNKQARDWGNLRVSYTLSKAITILVTSSSQRRRTTSIYVTIRACLITTKDIDLPSVAFSRYRQTSKQGVPVFFEIFSLAIFTAGLRVCPLIL